MTEAGDKSWVKTEPMVPASSQKYIFWWLCGENEMWLISVSDGQSRVLLRN